jgi:hypothetical protein
MMCVAAPAMAASGDDPCIKCHQNVTPGIVVQYNESKHAGVGVKCYVCHKAMDGDPSGRNHNGFKITAVPSPRYCEGCHATEVEQNTNSKHAWTAFIGPLKPYWIEAKKRGLDPLAASTARLLGPDEMARRALSPLFPDSGILKRVGLLDDPKFRHTNINIGCIECHGSFMTVNEDGTLNGWPNAGVGRINPDGSLGACSSCHTRHTFSVAEARSPETCGQCHLGPDHPQAEIYEESKHGNIFFTNVGRYNMDAAVGEWGPDDIGAPTCATCHMSQFGSVAGTHNVGTRLYWELQPPKSVMQWKHPSDVDDIVTQTVPDQATAELGRKTMKQVCNQCHSPQWVNGHFTAFDEMVSDYNMLWDNVTATMKRAKEEGLINADNPIDETPEIQAYLIWHHDGRRMRMGAAMMGPDWAHWNGAVDAIMNKYGALLNDLDMRRAIKKMGGSITPTN